KEEQTTRKPEDEAACRRFLEQSDHGRTVPGGLGSTYSRQEYGSHRVCDGRRKEDTGESHAGQDSVCTYRSAAVQAVQLQAGRDGGGFYALEESYCRTVCSQR